MKQYEGALRCVQVMPLEDEGVPLHQIYGSVLVEEDQTAIKKTRRPDEPSGRKALDSIRDMFNDKLVRRIIVHGEAGHGKTVFCLKLIDSWSKTQISYRDTKRENAGIKHRDKQTNKTEASWSKICNRRPLGVTGDSKASRVEQSFFQLVNTDKESFSCLSSFDLVFYVPLRYAKRGTSSIVDLVCDSVSECDQSSKDKIKQMLGDKGILSLVILDGLDEWRAPDTCRVQGFPDSDGLVNCTLLCTMRPWKTINLQLGLDRSCDKVVQILGLKRESVNMVISNILVNFYGLKPSSDIYYNKFCNFCKKATLQGLENVPLMLAASCLVWYEEDKECSSSSETNQGTSDFMTLLYVKLLKIMISRAAKKHDMVRSCKKQQAQIPPKNKPKLFSKFHDIIKFIEVLIPVGRLALQDLVSEEMHLVFARDELEDDIGEWKVELALKAGILSQTKAPGKCYEEQVSISFFHKSFQEFMAALYMVWGDTKALMSFRTQCYTVDKVMELSNMIMFVCGLDPVVGCQLSGHVRDVVNNNADFIQYRESTTINLKVREMYNIQCKWYN